MSNPVLLAFGVSLLVTGFLVLIIMPAWHAWGESRSS